MNTPFPESDWRAFRKLREVALERFCERILEEVSALGSSAGGTHHARYLAVYSLILKRDEEIARAFNGSRRSNARMQLHQMLSLGLILADELQAFTPQTRSVLEALPQPFTKTHSLRGG